MKKEPVFTTSDTYKLFVAMETAYNPIIMAIRANPDCNTLFINDKDWGRIDKTVAEEVSKRVTVQPTALLEEGKAFLYRMPTEDELLWGMLKGEEE